MTTLNAFAKAADTVADHLGKYYALRDPKEITAAIETLQEQISVLQTEMSDPQLQESVVTLTRMTGEGLLSAVEQFNALCLRNEEYLADGPVEPDKLVRVRSSVEADERVFLMRVTMLNDTTLIMAPVVAA